MRVKFAAIGLLLVLALGGPSIQAEEAEPGTEYAPEFPDPLPFDPAEWTTNDPPPSIADPRAQKGGRIVLPMAAWPVTLRTDGPNARSVFTGSLHGMIYESLLDFDPLTMKSSPGLARYWRALPDGLTHHYRIDERARWGDGREVTADDVVATIEHLLSPDRREPVSRQFWSGLIESARMLDKYTVEIRARETRWLGAVTLGGMWVFPAAYIRMSGRTYLDDWNWKLPPGTGPYEIPSGGVEPGTSITLTRRNDYWARDLPRARGAFNFDEIEWRFAGDVDAAYHEFLEGNLDVFRVGRAQRWAEEVDQEKPIQMGWVQKRKIYNQVPQGFGGFCFNLREAPFDSRDVRAAFAHLFNRKKLFTDFFFGEYEYMDSYFPGQPWAREGAAKIPYDPEKARQLLRKAGWSDRDDEGYLVNEKGERFPVISLPYAAPGFRRIHEVVQKDLWEQAGIKMDLELVDYYAPLLKKVWEHDYQVVYWSWTGSLLPNPIQNFHSKFADRKRTNNIGGFKNAEADHLMEAYQTEPDPAKRKAMLQRLDEILFDTHLYALGWYAPHFRLLFWDKFGHPPEYQAPTLRDWGSIMVYWWADEERADRTEQNKIAGTPSYADAPGHQAEEVVREWWRTNDSPMPNGQ